MVGADGKELKGMEQIRAGLQELGPRATLKLRRIDRGIGRADPGPGDVVVEDQDNGAASGPGAEDGAAAKDKKKAKQKQDGNVEWEWKAKMEKVRTRFNL